MRKDQLKLLSDMDEKLKMLDEFNGQIKEFHAKVVSMYLTIHFCLVDKIRYTVERFEHPIFLSEDGRTSLYHISCIQNPSLTDDVGIGIF